VIISVVVRKNDRLKMCLIMMMIDIDLSTSTDTKEFWMVREKENLLLIVF
jgi:hypothetical protein